MEHLSIENRQGIALLWLDQPGEKVNVLNEAMLERFPDCLTHLENDDTVKAVVLISAKKQGFIAGADLDMLKQVSTASAGTSLSQQGQQLLDRLAAFPKPVIAAIHGACLGGGLEVALACSHRIAANHAKTFLGLPEVKLGLLPGSGGTQRLPKLMGLQAGLDAMLTGKNIYPRQALRSGLVDLLVPLEGLPGSAVAFAKDILAGWKPKSRSKPMLTRMLDNTIPGRWLVLKMAKKAVLKKSGGHYPAPLKILQAVQAGLQSRKKGDLQEAKGFGELLVSPESQALRQLFFNMNHSKKVALETPPVEVKHLGILGAGLMGTGIAQVSNHSSREIYIKDISHETLTKARRVVEQEWQKKVKKRIARSFEKDRVTSHLHLTLDYQRLAKADLIIEAVFEDLKLKHAVLADVESVTKDTCIFASNTSAIPIGDIAKKSKRPDQVIGMHYFSPIPKMPLLEIIVTEQTADWVQATAWKLGVDQGKHVIIVKDGPGFYTTRILAPMLNEALLLLEEGVPVERIDHSMKRFGFPVGPIALLDEVGIDVGAHVSKTLSPMFEKRGGKTSEAFKSLVNAGFQGRKNGKGFYLYEKKGKKTVNPEIATFFPEKETSPLSAEIIQKRMVYMMVNEAVHCLNEGILKNEQDGDLGAILGLGFPPFLGGPFHWVKQQDQIFFSDQLTNFANRFGERFRPAALKNPKS